MSERHISLELATDLAWVHNEAHDAAEEALRSVADAQRLERLGHALGENTLSSLVSAFKVAEAGLQHVSNAVPNFREDVIFPTSDSIDTSPESLSPEQKQFKESLLEGFEASYGTYTTLLDVMNGTKDRKKEKLEVASEDEAKEAVEALLTPGVIREAMRQMEEFSTNPEANSPEVGFDIILAPNEDLSANDETAVAKHIQGKLKKAYSGDDYIYEPFHNEDTAHAADRTGELVVAVLAPRHLNIRRGEATSGLTATGSQKAAVEAQNKQLEQDRVELVTSGIDMLAMTHITHLIEDGVIDTENGDYLEKRFWATYYKDVLSEPVGGLVPDVCVFDRGRFARDYSFVDVGAPSRALVVNKA